MADKFYYACKICDRLRFEGDLKNLIDDCVEFVQAFFLAIVECRKEYSDPRRAENAQHRAKRVSCKFNQHLFFCGNTLLFLTVCQTTRR